MIVLNPDCRYFLYRVPVNINKSFYSLAAIVREQMHTSPVSRDVFIFLNNKRNQIKLLFGREMGLPFFIKDWKRVLLNYPCSCIISNTLSSTTAS